MIAMIFGWIFGGLALLLGMSVLLWALRGTPRQILCRHGKWGPCGFSYIKCGKCGWTKCSPGECSALNAGFMKAMVDRGAWDVEEAHAKAAKHGIRF